MRARHFLLWTALAAMIATPALTQNPGPASVAKPAVPDFSGVWAHPFLTGYEPPASGPGPVLNTSRSPNGVANFRRLIGDYNNPILKPDAAERVKQFGEITKAGGGYPTPSNQCWPGGLPYVFWDFLVQMFQEQDQITMIYRHGNEVRRVHMNERHPEKVKPSWYGHSVGRYEGDTLVIDTVGIKQGPFAMVDMYGTPFSDKLRVVERYRLMDYNDAKDAVERNLKENFRAGGSEYDPRHRGKVLQLHFTVEDENVFTTPWTATITYFPSTIPWTELICAENRREADGTHDMKVPTAEKLDF